MTQINARHPTDMMEQLIEVAYFRGFLTASPEHYRVKRLIETGSVWPDDLKPGAVLLSLTPDQRTVLAKLTPNDLNHRVDSIPFLPRR
jgi:hypothetical protein